MTGRPQVPADPPTFENPSFGATRRRASVIAVLLIVGAALAAYHNSFSGPFIFDDVHAIVENPTIRELRTAPFPPAGSGLTVSGRPLLNLSFAINYALGGTSVRGYHILNLALHILAGLTLFGVARRTLELSRRVGNNAPYPLACAIALLWTVHPLQTESVTYIVQRAESLVALFYLLTLYAFIRGAGGHVIRDNHAGRPSGSSGSCHVSSDKPDQPSSDHPRTGHSSGDMPLEAPHRIWFTLSVAACLLGMASKEVMATAPLLVLLYDRTFIADTFRGAWRQRRPVYLGLASTWLLLAALVVAAGGRGHTAGFGAGMDWRAYALTQCRALLLYLKLSVWPHPLVLDYGDGVVTNVVAVLPQVLVLAGLIAGAIVALRSECWRWLGFLGCWYFAILAPTSSVVPVATQTMAEHRMCLPLAAVLTLAAVGLHALIGRRGVFVAAALAVALGVLTARRNGDYRSALAIWNDTATKWPDNARAHSALGDALLRAGHAGEAIPHYERALKLKPDNGEFHGAMGNALAETGRIDEALQHLTEAVRLAPADARTHTNLGNALLKAGRLDEAIRQQRAAVRLDPTSADMQFNLANSLVQTAALAEAVVRYGEALRLNPDFIEARFNLGNALATLGRFAEAVAAYRAVLQRDPTLVAAWCNLGHALDQSGRTAEAVASFEEALRRAPASAEAREGLARLRAATQ